MAQIKVAVHGALGKMGQEVLRALYNDPALEAVAGVDIKAESEVLTLPSSPHPVPLSADLQSALDSYQPDVLVDFSNAEATIPAVRAAVKHHVRLVIGTTGLAAADLEEIKSLCNAQRIGAVVAPNFSLAAVMMMHLAKIAAGYFDYAEIIELHHEQKADAPSGTAVSTAKEMVEARGKPFIYTSAKHENVAGSRGGELDGVALHSVRLPGMLAHQEVIFGAPGQTLRIRLDQINREAFMPCVMLAVKKVMELDEAVFGLNTLLGLKVENC